jgi:hypothetical protein
LTEARAAATLDILERLALAMINEIRKDIVIDPTAIGVSGQAVSVVECGAVAVYTASSSLPEGQHVAASGVVRGACG